MKRQDQIKSKKLQQFANDSGLKILVNHFPAGTSKLNKIEHRLFSNTITICLKVMNMI